MNTHPILVHFPIAFMTIYAILELIRFQKVKNWPYIVHIKAFLLIVGTLSSFVALSTGEVAEHLANRDLRPLIEVHSAFASGSVWIFGILSVVYIVSFVSKSEWNQKLLDSPFSKIWKLKVNIANKILNGYFSVILALAGLVAITITGALGGAIVYGPEVDPIVNFIYKLFF